MPLSPAYTFCTCELSGNMVTIFVTSDATSADDPATAAPVIATDYYCKVFILRENVNNNVNNKHFTKFK